MAKDIKDLFKNDTVSHEKMPKNHKNRFVKKLDEAFPESPIVFKRKWLTMAASVVVLLGLSFGAYSYFQPATKSPSNTVAATIEPPKTKTLGDISPGLKKVEDYYLASINLELSKMKPTADTKELFDNYILQLKELDEEYKLLSMELTISGPTELTVNALIDNLKFRLNLLYRLRTQLKQLDTSKNAKEVKQF